MSPTTLTKKLRTLSSTTLGLPTVPYLRAIYTFYMEYNSVASVLVWAQLGLCNKFAELINYKLITKIEEAFH